MDDPNRTVEDVDGDEYLDDDLLEEDAEHFEGDLEQLDRLDRGPDDV
jgi:hypothetical protein